MPPPHSKKRHSAGQPGLQKVRLCPEYQRTKPCCNRDCSLLHICQAYLAGSCRLGAKCPYSHRCGTPENKAFLEEHKLTNIECEKDLQKRLNFALPKICLFYQERGKCNHRDCNFLHICADFFKGGKCLEKKCEKSHEFDKGPQMKFLRTYNISCQDVTDDEAYSVLLADDMPKPGQISCDCARCGQGGSRQRNGRRCGGKARGGGGRRNAGPSGPEMDGAAAASSALQRSPGAEAHVPEPDSFNDSVSGKAKISPESPGTDSKHAPDSANTSENFPKQLVPTLADSKTKHTKTDLDLKSPVEAGADDEEDGPIKVHDSNDLNSCSDGEASSGVRLNIGPKPPAVDEESDDENEMETMRTNEGERTQIKIQKCGDDQHMTDSSQDQPSQHDPDYYRKDQAIHSSFQEEQHQEMAVDPQNDLGTANVSSLGNGHQQHTSTTQPIQNFNYPANATDVTKDLGLGQQQAKTSANQIPPCPANVGVTFSDVQPQAMLRVYPMTQSHAIATSGVGEYPAMSNAHPMAHGTASVATSGVGGYPAMSNAHPMAHGTASVAASGGGQYHAMPKAYSVVHGPAGVATSSGQQQAMQNADTSHPVVYCHASVVTGGVGQQQVPAMPSVHPVAQGPANFSESGQHQVMPYAHQMTQGPANFSDYAGQPQAMTNDYPVAPAPANGYQMDTSVPPVTPWDDDGNYLHQMADYRLYQQSPHDQVMGVPQGSTTEALPSHNLSYNGTYDSNALGYQQIMTGPPYWTSEQQPVLPYTLDAPSQHLATEGPACYGQPQANSSAGNQVNLGLLPPDGTEVFGHLGHGNSFQGDQGLNTANYTSQYHVSPVTPNGFVGDTQGNYTQENQSFHETYIYSSSVNHQQVLVRIPLGSNQLNPLGGRGTPF